MTRPTQEIDAYLDGEPTPEEARALQAWIQADKANAKAFLAAIRLHQQIGTQLRKDRFDQALHSTGQTATTKDGDAAIQALAELARLHEEGLKQPIDLERHRKQQAQAAAANQGRARRLSMKFIATGSLAAAIAIAGLTVLAINLFSGPDQPIAEQPIEPISITVATLTDATDAVWENQAGDALDLPINSPMTQGQHLTLTEGFAEITTNRGAIAIIQAPATIELLDNDNALRLHGGKLIGICETDSSKGFLVRTPHLDITDLGTRFGVDASHTGTTEVHVLEGEVQAVRTNANADATPTRLIAGQSARSSANTDTITAIDHDADRFAALTPRTGQLQGTGFGLAVGDTDPNWRIIAINGTPLADAGQMKVTSGGSTTARPPSRWVTATQSYPQQTNPETMFTVQTQFDLPAGIDGDSAALQLQFDANDRVIQVRVNGRAIEPPANSRDDGHQGMHTMRIASPLLESGNTLQLDVVDVKRANSAKWELRVAWSIQPTQAPASEVSQ